MQKILFLFILALSLNACKDPSKDAASPYPQYLTMEEVKNIADKYGAGDMAVPEKNSLLMYMPPEEVDAYFKRIGQIRAKQKEEAQYFIATKNVHSFDDYLTLLQSLSALYEAEVERKGGPAGFQKWVDEQRAVKWHIYRNEQGVLGWVPPGGDLARESRLGERMDKNP